MHEIKIYGEIVPFEDAWIMESGGFSNLTSVQNQLKEAAGEDVRVRINSCGGDVDTGFAIYAELRRYAKDNNAKVETFGEARVASIATVIFLAGDRRILTEHTEPFVHNAWCYALGDAKEIMRTAVELDKYNKKIAEHYALHTDLTYDEAIALMEDETSITTDEAVNMRFATAIEEVLRPVALQRFSNPIINKEMAENKKTKSVLAKIEAFIKGFGVQNKIVNTADEQEVDFYELEEDAVVAIGDKARIDGADADGSYVMKSGETYVFVAGELTEIIEEESEETLEEVIAERDALAAQLETVMAKATTIEAENKKLTGIVAKYKSVGSQPAPDGKKERQKPTVVENKAKAAVANLGKFKTK